MRKIENRSCINDAKQRLRAACASLRKRIPLQMPHTLAKTAGEATHFCAPQPISSWKRPGRRRQRVSVRCGDGGPIDPRRARMRGVAQGSRRSRRQCTGAFAGAEGRMRPWPLDRQAGLRRHGCIAWAVPPAPAHREPPIHLLARQIDASRPANDLTGAAQTEIVATQLAALQGELKPQFVKCGGRNSRARSIRSRLARSTHWRDGGYRKECCRHWRS